MKKTLCFATVSAGAVLVGTGVAPIPDGPWASDRSRAHSIRVEAGESVFKISQPEADGSNRWEKMFAHRDSIASPEGTEVNQVVAIPSKPVPVAVEPSPRVAPAPAPASVQPSPSVTTTTRPKAPTTTQPRPAISGGGEDLAAIRACESGGNYGAVSSDGRYRGAYQFEQATWEAMAGSGDPAAAPPAEQDARALQLWRLLGSNPWPNCG